MPVDLFRPPPGVRILRDGIGYRHYFHGAVTVFVLGFFLCVIGAAVAVLVVHEGKGTMADAGCFLAVFGGLGGAMILFALSFIVRRSEVRFAGSSLRLFTGIGRLGIHRRVEIAEIEFVEVRPTLLKVKYGLRGGPVQEMQFFAVRFGLAKGGRKFCSGPDREKLEYIAAWLANRLGVRLSEIREQAKPKTVAAVPKRNEAGEVVLRLSNVSAFSIYLLFFTFGLGGFVLYMAISLIGHVEMPMLLLVAALFLGPPAAIEVFLIGAVIHFLFGRSEIHLFEDILELRSGIGVTRKRRLLKKQEVKTVEVRSLGISWSPTRRSANNLTGGHPFYGLYLNGERFGFSTDPMELEAVAGALREHLEKTP